MRLREGYFRADRITRPASAVPLRPLRPTDTWCDDPGSPSYNRHSNREVSYKHEKMWLSGEVYDLVFVLDYNLTPRVKGLGSAIFFHLTKKDRTPTAGCIAIDLPSIRRLLPRLSARVVFVVR
jgi:L,D-peptidoglycan transpeptidase YkuD (ErfK/YbiS/YcfS/YnhG family)